MYTICMDRDTIADFFHVLRNFQSGELRNHLWYELQQLAPMEREPRACN